MLGGDGGPATFPNIPQKRLQNGTETTPNVSYVPSNVIKRPKMPTMFPKCSYFCPIVTNVRSVAPEIRL